MNTINHEQQAERNWIREFVRREIVPYAQEIDREQNVPPNLIRRLAEAGLLGWNLPVETGGGGHGATSVGILHEEVGRACASIRAILTVHQMVGQAIFRWGSHTQKAHWLPQLATGQQLAAFGLTEPEVGSDAVHVRATAERSDAGFRLNGHKKWITAGQVANVFLVFAQCEDHPNAFIVPVEQPGIRIAPIQNMLGLRASMLADVYLDEVFVPHTALLGPFGGGITHVALHALEFGRLAVANGCIGIAKACLEEVLAYASKREQFGVPLLEHQLIQRMISNMVTGVKAGSLLCIHAAHLQESGEPQAMLEIMIAKYYASRVAADSARDAVQILGANGCSSNYSVERHFRDSKIMEIIEGTNEIHQSMIGRYAHDDF